MNNMMIPLVSKDLIITNLQNATSLHQLKDMEYIQMSLSEYNKFEDISKAERDQRFAVFKLDYNNNDFRD